MIIRAGGGYNSNGGSSSENNIVGWRPKSEVITANGYYVVPKAKDQEFHVRLFGGGGGCVQGVCMRATDILAMGGGGGGNMNNDALILNIADSIPVTIGAGGNLGGNGGTTSFGTYLSATGGSIGRVREMGLVTGGNGGTGGGSYDYYLAVSDVGDTNYSGSGCQGGNAIYGGGGGSSGRKGTYGGNGGNQNSQSTNGTNTVNKTGLDFIGDGKRGTYARPSDGYISGWGCGSGGYGGNGGSSYNGCVSGGGGGYGANGGNGYVSISTQYVPGTVTWRGTYMHGGAGGGGGYGGKGGNGYSSSTVCRGGYGGGYGPENYGRGGGSEYNNGKAGIIIITYQEPIYA